MELKLQGITKKFDKQVALNQVTLELTEPGVLGVLGANGAGKSTLMRLIMNLIEADSGSISFDGKSFSENSKSIKSNIGYLSESNPMYEDLYVQAYLEFHAKLKDIPFSRVQELMKDLRIDTVSNKRIMDLSKGFKQRVGVASAMLHEPDLLILDEPTSGLDPIQLQQFREVIRSYARTHTVLFSSHIMQEVEAVCDRVIFLKQGELVGDFMMKDLKNEHRRTFELNLDYRLELEFFKELEGLQSVENVFDTQYRVHFDKDQKQIISSLSTFCESQGVELISIVEKSQGLEDLFIKLNQA
ncbi:MAG: ABC transporter ATP-binding protein [Flavobacteriaceae bacterium]